MARVEEGHFWFRAKRALASRFLREARRAGARGCAIDLGCGTGANLRRLLGDLGGIGLDGDAEGLRFCRERGAARLVRADGSSIPIRGAAAGVVLALDVLEHLEDDEAALAEIARILRPGGFLLANVPALPALFSEHDRALGHRRRYRRGELEARARAAGFAILRSTGWGFPLLPFVALSRRFRRAGARSDVHEIPSLLNGGFAGLLGLERAALRLGRLPAGLSWMVLARKP